MRCIEIAVDKTAEATNKVININMRCIEMNVQYHYKLRWFWLTLTWDVLKFCACVSLYNWLPGLTLTWDVLKFRSLCAFFPCALRLTLTWDVLKLSQIEVAYQNTVRLTLTWDVLKWYCYKNTHIRRYWLTLTWDVLKLVDICYKGICYVININMRCIEMYPNNLVP